MDLTNLGESLDTANADGGRRACDERLTKEFKGACSTDASRRAANNEHVQNGAAQ